MGGGVGGYVCCIAKYSVSKGKILETCILMTIPHFQNESSKRHKALGRLRFNMYFQKVYFYHVTII